MGSLDAPRASQLFRFGARSTGKEAVGHDRTISDMLISLEIEPPHVTMVLPAWDLGVALEALALCTPALGIHQLFYLKDCLLPCKEGRCTELLTLLIHIKCCSSHHMELGSCSYSALSSFARTSNLLRLMILVSFQLCI